MRLLALPLLLLVAVLAAVRADDPPPRRLALVIGVGRYDAPKHYPDLPYAERDAAEVAAEFRKAGYEVTLLLGGGAGAGRATRANCEAAFARLTAGRPRRDDLLVVALSGHGEQTRLDAAEEPCFCPSDASRTDAGSLVRLNAWLAALDGRAAGTHLVLVDACRDNPAKIGLDVDRVRSLGLGTAVFFACSGGQRAYESDKAGGGHGVFFHFVLEGLRGKAANARGAVTWDRLVGHIKEQVDEQFAELVQGRPKQVPHVIGNLAAVPPLVSPPAADGATYVSKATGMQFVRIKAGTFLMGLPKSEDVLYETQHKVTLTKEFCMGKYEVTRGQFRRLVDATRYKTEGEADGKGGQGLTDTGWEHKPEFTWRTPGFEQTDGHPVVLVSWKDAVRFAEWLSQVDGRMYRLPTEAEWEYACRGGTTTPFHFGSDSEQLAWFDNVGDAAFKARYQKNNLGAGVIVADDGYVYTAPVGSYRPNPFGLYDMHGNVSEWCGDWKGKYPSVPVIDPVGSISGTCRVFRGGDWNSFPNSKIVPLDQWAQSAARHDMEPAYRCSTMGFRLVMVPSGR